jgi:cyclopropane fatty-acyl-phospholipid synthase-like methyltransferase
MQQHGSYEAKARIADRLLETMKLQDSDIVVDVGSGDGYYSSRFAEHCKKVVAIDASCEVFKSQYYARSNIETVCESACAWIKTNKSDWSNRGRDIAREKFM